MDRGDHTGFFVMAAMCKGRGVGNEGHIPWPPIKEDYYYYMELTSRVTSSDRKCVNIQGRKTWEGTGSQQRKRNTVFNIVLTRDERRKEELSKDPDVHKVMTSLDDAIEFSLALENRDKLESVWVMGGQVFFEESLRHPLCERIYLTKILEKYPADRFFPKIDKNTYKEVSCSAVQESRGIKFKFKIFERIK